MKLIIRNGTILRGDPAQEIQCDLVVENGVITEIGNVPVSPAAGQVIDASGKVVIPGLVDIHAHYITGKEYGYNMLISAGVTTALDPLIGNAKIAKETVLSCHAGVNTGALLVLKPGLTVADSNPGRRELEKIIDLAVSTGAFGVKIIGAHCPMTPEATALAIRIAAEKSVPLMFHAGDTVHRDDLKGMTAAVECGNGNPFILAHVNAYCDGHTMGNQNREALEALELLAQHPEIVCESSLSELSCIGTRMKDDVPESLCMTDILHHLGFPANYQGMLCAVEQGKLAVSGPVPGGEFAFLDHAAAVARFKELHGAVTVGYHKHEMSKNILLATGKNSGGKFIIRTLTTDGGVVPRNITLAKGLALVRAGVFTLSEFTAQSSRAGALILGLDKKGILETGCDADIVIADIGTGKAETVISGGTVVRHNGKAFPAPNHFFELDPGCGKRQLYWLDK